MDTTLDMEKKLFRSGMTGMLNPPQGQDEDHLTEHGRISWMSEFYWENKNEDPKKGEMDIKKIRQMLATYSQEINDVDLYLGEELFTIFENEGHHACFNEEDMTRNAEILAISVTVWKEVVLCMQILK
eukprot:scaffold29670_cov55-Attheya_sp.AAC.3